MTEASPEPSPTLTEVLVRHGIYDHNGLFRIAIMDNTLQDLTGNDTFQVDPSEVTLLEAPGSPEWVDRMIRIRRSVTRRMVTAEDNLRDKIDYFERLKEAILEVANERQWCEEYDAFAEEWGLTPRFKDFEITVTLTVRAKDKEGALDYVRGNVNLDSYLNEDVQSGPEFEASEA